MNKTQETVQVDFEKYYIDGVHVCANDFESGKVCDFLGSKSFGCKPVCMVTGEQLFSHENNTIKPHEKCILKGAGQ